MENYKGIFLKMALVLEAAGGIEPPNKGFADPCLTTWLRRPEMEEANTTRTVVDSAIAFGSGDRS